MKEYTIYCTEAQTKIALELGASMNLHPFHSSVIKGNERLFEYIVCIDDKYYCLPTAEQMIGWLRKEHNIFFSPKKVGDNNYVLIGDLKHFQSYDSYEEATLAGIDAALEYLSKNSK